MAETNEKIIFKATCAYLGIDEPTGGALVLAGRFPAYHTYQAWQECGYQVQKGQKAAFSARIWKMTEKKTDKGEEHRLIMKFAYFFGRNQVDPIQTKGGK